MSNNIEQLYIPYINELIFREQEIRQERKVEQEKKRNKRYSLKTLEEALEFQGEKLFWFLDGIRTDLKDIEYFLLRFNRKDKDKQSELLNEAKEQRSRVEAILKKYLGKEYKD